MFEELMSLAEESDESGSRRRRKKADRFAGGLVNVILGALILWVGQTTFHHAGQLASVDERFQTIEHQFNSVDNRYDNLRHRLEETSTETQERTRSRFTREDGEKLAANIKELHEFQMMLERQFTERISNLQMKLISIEASGNNQHELSQLNAEVERLRAQIAMLTQSRTPYAQAMGRSTAANPTYLPPVTQHR